MSGLEITDSVLYKLSFSTLTNPKFNEISGGRSLETEKAELEGYAMDETGEFPIIRHDPEETTLDILYKNVDAETLARFLFTYPPKQHSPCYLYVRRKGVNVKSVFTNFLLF